MRSSPGGDSGQPVFAHRGVGDAAAAKDTREGWRMTQPRFAVVSVAVAAAAYLVSFSVVSVEGQARATEAPTGFDNLTNGFVSQATMRCRSRDVRGARR